MDHKTRTVTFRLSSLLSLYYEKSRFVGQKREDTVNIETALDKIYRSRVNTFEHVHQYHRFEFLLQWFQLQASKLWMLYCVHPTLVGGLICVNTIHKKNNLLLYNNMHVYKLSKHEYCHDTGAYLLTQLHLANFMIRRMPNRLK